VDRFDTEVSLGSLDIAEQLARWPLLAALAPAQLSQLAAGSQRVTVARGEILFLRSTPATCFYGVVSGVIELSVSNADGVAKVLEIIRPDQTFGEAVMFLQGRFPVDAKALADTEVIRVPAHLVEAVLDADPKCSRAMLASLSKKLHSLVRDVQMYTLHSANERVIGHLLGLLGSSAGSGPGTVELLVSKQVVASRLGMTPETFSRVLHELSSDGLIAVRGRSIYVPDEGALAARLL
jgi:CRP-like cAMP-binding protein